MLCFHPRLSPCLQYFLSSGFVGFRVDSFTHGISNAGSTGFEIIEYQVLLYSFNWFSLSFGATHLRLDLLGCLELGLLLWKWEMKNGKTKKFPFPTEFEFHHKATRHTQPTTIAKLARFIFFLGLDKR